MFDVAMHRVVAKVPVGADPTSVAVSADGRFAYTSGGPTGDRCRSSTPRPSKVAADLDVGAAVNEMVVRGDSLIVGTGKGVALLDAATGQRRGEVDATGYLGAVSPDGRTAYLFTDRAGQFVKLDLSGLRDRELRPARRARDPDRVLGGRRIGVLPRRVAAIDRRRRRRNESCDQVGRAARCRQQRGSGVARRPTRLFSRSRACDGRRGAGGVRRHHRFTPARPRPVGQRIARRCAEQAPGVDRSPRAAATSTFNWSRTTRPALQTATARTSND